MSERLSEFIQKLTNESVGYAGYAQYVNWYIQNIQNVKDVDEVLKMSTDELTDVLVKVKPTNARAVSGYLNAIRRYAEYAGNQEFVEMSKAIDTTEVFNKYSVSRDKKYMPSTEFKAMIDNIDMSDLPNAEYYSTLLQAIYEGIYSDDMSALKNLRGQDVHDDYVIVRCDGKEPFKLSITRDLSHRLTDLSEMTTWKRKNRCGEFDVPIEGIYHDSCFKTENRYTSAGSDRPYRYSYYRCIRKVAEVLGLEKPLRAKAIYIAGIINRVKPKLESKGMSLEETFSFRRKWGEDLDIVKAELERVYYPYAYRDFTKLVTGYVSDFYD